MYTSFQALFERDIVLLCAEVIGQRELYALLIIFAKFNNLTAFYCPDCHTAS